MRTKRGYDIMSKYYDFSFCLTLIDGIFITASSIGLFVFPEQSRGCGIAIAVSISILIINFIAGEVLDKLTNVKL